jgi:hypothetical protein
LPFCTSLWVLISQMFNAGSRLGNIWKATDIKLMMTRKWQWDNIWKYWTNCAFGLYPSSGVSKNKQNRGIKNIDKIGCIHTWTLEASQTLVAISDPATAHFTALKNLGNTSIATGVWLASRVHMCMRPGKLLCG